MFTSAHDWGIRRLFSLIHIMTGVVLKLPSAILLRLQVTQYSWNRVAPQKDKRGLNCVPCYCYIVPFMENSFESF